MKDTLIAIGVFAAMMLILCGIPVAFLAWFLMFLVRLASVCYANQGRC